MLTIIVSGSEFYNDDKQEFVYGDNEKLLLEHSLISISKWESKWQKPFLHTSDKTPEQVLDYVKCMTINKPSDESVYDRLDSDNFDEINKYISSPMTATWFNDLQTKPNHEIVTSELIYYWMISFGVPFECQKWHINRLLTLIRICGIKNSPSRKMTRQEVLAQNRALNAARRKQYRTRG